MWFVFSAFHSSIKIIVTVVMSVFISSLCFTNSALAASSPIKTIKAANEYVGTYVNDLQSQKLSNAKILGKLKILKSQYARKKKLKSYTGDAKKQIDATISAIDKNIIKIKKETKAKAVPIPTVPVQPSSSNTSQWMPIIQGTSASAVDVTPVVETSVCKTQKVYDVENNEYSTVTVGGKCWTQSNLRVTKYRDGTPIEKAPILSPYEWRGPDWKTTDHSFYSCPTNVDGKGENCHLAITHGFLYQWSAAMNKSTEEGNQGLCPTGWHIPTLLELEDLVKSQWPPADCYNSDTQLCDIQGSRLAGKVKNSDWIAWNWFSWGINGLGFGMTGFDVLATGRDGYYKGTQSYWGTSAAIWSSSRAIDTKFKYCQPGDICSWQLSFNYMTQNVDIYNTGNYSTASVRCVQN